MTNKIKQQLVLTILIFAAAVFVYFNYILSPINQKYNDAVVRLQQIEAKLNDLKIRAQELPKLKAEMEYLQKEVAQLEKLLPQKEEIPGLLRIVTRRAQKYALQINSISPSKSIPKENYNEIPLQINLRGRYHSLGRFLTEIGQEMRLIGARNVILSYSPSVDKNDSRNMMADFALIAYSYKQ